MRQKRFPCCKEPMGEDDIWNEIDAGGDTMGITNKNINCPHCGKALTVFLNIDSVEVSE